MVLKRVAVAAVLFCTVTLHAQFQTVVIQPVKARSPSGTIQDPNGDPVEGAKVQLVDCPIGRSYPSEPHKVLAEMRSDRRGNFTVDARYFHAPYCFHITAYGFDNLEVEVRTSRFAKPLYLKLVIAT